MTVSSRLLKHAARCPRLYTHQPVNRSFFSLPATDATVLRETRVLPYNAVSVYELIADVGKYSSFLPYCQKSEITKWSGADEGGKRWPAEASLTVGWGNYEETFTSTLFCVPNSIVEAVGGEAESSVPKSSLKHYRQTPRNREPANVIFKTLSTKWTVRPVNKAPRLGQAQYKVAPEQTEVKLDITFQFANPLYAVVSKAVTPKVAAALIEAFEARAKALLGTGGSQQGN